MIIPNKNKTLYLYSQKLNRLPMTLKEKKVKLKDEHVHIMTATVLEIYNSGEEYTELPLVYKSLSTKLFSEKNKIEVSGFLLRQLENRGWLKSVFITSEPYPIPAFQLTERSRVLLDLISEK